jgi:RNA polymerase sigma factor CnrH
MDGEQKSGIQSSSQGPSTLAIEAYYRAYGSRAHAIARQITHCDDDAADIVHEVFARILLAPAGLLSATKPDAYVLRAVRNAAINWDTRRRRRACILAVTGTVDAAAAADDPLQQAESAEARRLLRRAFSQLPQPCKRVVELHVLHDRSQSQVAAMLGISTKAVERRMARARAILTRTCRGGAVLAGLIVDTLGVRRGVQAFAELRSRLPAPNLALRLNLAALRSASY